MSGSFWTRSIGNGQGQYVFNQLDNDFREDDDIDPLPTTPDECWEIIADPTLHELTEIFEDNPNHRVVFSIALQAEFSRRNDDGTMSAEQLSWFRSSNHIIQNQDGIQDAMEEALVEIQAQYDEFVMERQPNPDYDPDADDQDEPEMIGSGGDIGSFIKARLSYKLVQPLAGATLFLSKDETLKLMQKEDFPSLSSLNGLCFSTDELVVQLKNRFSGYPNSCFFLQIAALYCRFREPSRFRFTTEEILVQLHRLVPVMNQYLMGVKTTQLRTLQDRLTELYQHPVQLFIYTMQEPEVYTCLHPSETQVKRTGDMFQKWTSTGCFCPQVLLVKNHWVGIINMETFNKVERNKGVDRHTRVCPLCLKKIFGSMQRIESHLQFCLSTGYNTNMKMPNPGSFTAWNNSPSNFSKCIRAPIVGYLDFESILTHPSKVQLDLEGIELNEDEEEDSEEDIEDHVENKRRKVASEFQANSELLDEAAKKTSYQKVHTPGSMCLVIEVDSDHLIPKFPREEKLPHKIHRYRLSQDRVAYRVNITSYSYTSMMEEITKHLTFVNEVMYDRIWDHCGNKTPNLMFKRDTSGVCFLCDMPLNSIPPFFKLKTKYDTSGDNSFFHPFTGLYQGEAHHCCIHHVRNFQPNIPIFAHNCNGYDQKFLIQCLSQVSNNIWSERSLPDIQMLPKNQEQFITISYGSLEFRDSFNFLLKGLATCLKNLKPEELHHLNAFARTLPCDEVYAKDICSGKGVYPYSYMDSYCRYYEKTPPPFEKCFDELNEESMSLADYNRMCDVFSATLCTQMKDYTELYCSIDTLGLADCMHQFREITMKYFRIDPVYFCGAPGLAWCTALRMTKARLDLLTDERMYIAFENVRGGISQAIRHLAVSKDWAEETKFQLPSGIKDYPMKPGRIFYFDVNALYGGCMMDPLPCEGFEWVEDLGVIERHILTPEPDTGMLVCVDLEYPEELHALHRDLPLAPEHVVLKKDMLSRHSLLLLITEQGAHLKHPGHTPESFLEAVLAKQLPDTIKYPPNVKKLCTTLNPKFKYVTYCKTLRFYLSLGLRVTNIHYAIRFKEFAWLKPFIDFCTDRRKDAVDRGDKGGKDYWKLLPNSFYGKTMESVRKYSNIRAVTEWDEAQRLLRKPQGIKNFTIINRRLTLVEQAKPWANFNKPIYVGFTILELSKIVMYNLWYNVFQKVFTPQRLHLCAIDTDSFMCLVDGSEALIQENLKTLYEAGYLDTSSFPTDHPLYDPSTQMKPGKCKEELGLRRANVGVWLKAKNYYIEANDGRVEKKTKGCPRATRDKRHTLEAFLKQLEAPTGPIAQYDQFNKFSCEKQNLFTRRYEKRTLWIFDDKRKWSSNGWESFPHGWKPEVI